MAAHYAGDKEDDPLVGEELIDLMKATGWVEEREVVDWLKPLGLKIIAVRDDFARSHGMDINANRIAPTHE